MTRRNLSIAALVALSGTLAFGQAPTSAAFPGELSAASSEQLRAAYLECDRVTSTRSVGPDYMNACAEIGSALLHRDFGGDFQRQIDWWRSVRGTGPLQDKPLAATELQP